MNRINTLLSAAAFVAAATNATASLYGTGGVEAVVPGTANVTHTFTNANASETFTLSQAATVRMLVVGGGGGGGSDCAGGGGGGGVIEVASVTLPADTYTVTVGAGGAGGRSSQNGGIGGATMIADSNGTILYKALGGGGGVGYKGSTPVSTTDAPFASGGGGENKKSGSAAGDATQGYAGGTSAVCKTPQGGGGAGGAAIAKDNSGGEEKNWQSGNGGPGLVSDIRGVSEMFGAGGGGGAWGSGDRLRARPGAGGDGIGGFGAPEPWLATDATLACCHGRDGYGGGGGGGNNTSPYPGADGGSGCVIVRLSNVDAADPAPSIGGAALESATFFDATLSATLAAPGAGQAAASVLLQVAENAADLADAAEIPASAGADGLYRAKATGLRPAHAYVARFVARNAADEESATAAVAFSTPALAERALSIPSTSGYAGLFV